MQFHVRSIEAKLITSSSADEDVSLVPTAINFTDNEVLIENITEAAAASSTTS